MKFITSLAVSLLAGAQAFAACPAGTTDQSGQIDGKPTCLIKGSLLSANVTLNSANAYILEGDVRIGGDNTASSKLTIEAGTTIYGSQGAFLVISRGSQIYANGTATAPVVFTALERTNPTPGYWGGLVITGNAPVNNCKGAAASCDNIVEGIQNNAPKFGGNNPDDNSGVLNYVRSEYAGFTLSENNELNSITFYAVGRQTQVDYIEAYKGADDGIEIFGGTVNMKHIISIDNDDDGLDWDNGWQGHIQFALIVLENATEADPNGIEADNLKSPMDAMPRSNPTLSNITIVGKGTNPKLLNGVLLRHGTAGKLYNLVVTGNFQSCVNIDNEETFRIGGTLNNGEVEQTGLVMENSIAQCNNGVNFKDDAADAWLVSSWFNSPGKGNFVMDPQLKDLAPLEGSPALETGITPPVVAEMQWVNGVWTSADFFTPVDFVGALSGSADEDWTAGWAVK